MADEAGTKNPLTLTRILLWIGGGVLGLLLLVGVVNMVAPEVLRRGSGPGATDQGPTAARPRAAIVDQTGYSFPSPDFIAAARATLEDAGYDVTYYGPEEVTVTLYRTLPDRGYDLIVFQTHSTSQVLASDEEGGGRDPAPGPFLFTTELYEPQRHLTLQVGDQVRASELFFEGSPQLFAVGPAFVRRSMRGLFPDTVIIIGGCQSLAAPDLAEAFLEKGASVVIGWDEMVNLAHNNQAVLHLLDGLLVQGLMPAEAVQLTNTHLGPDPVYNSLLDLME